MLAFLDSSRSLFLNGREKRSKQWTMIYAAGSKGDCCCGADENKGDTAAATVRQKKKTTTTTTTTRRAEAGTGVGRDEDEEEAPPSPPLSSPLSPNPVFPPSLPPCLGHKSRFQKKSLFLHTDLGLAFVLHFFWDLDP
jgi:hypothetical protein